MLVLLVRNSSQPGGGGVGVHQNKYSNCFRRCGYFAGGGAGGITQGGPSGITGGNGGGGNGQGPGPGM